VNRDTKVLEIAGLEIDIAAECSDRLEDKKFHIGEDTSTAETIILKLWRDMCAKSEPINSDDPYVNGDSAAFAYMQTLNGCVGAWWQQ
jgi:hypothetical protein